jgi:hypothetical protein
VTLNPGFEYSVQVNRIDKDKPVPKFNHAYHFQKQYQGFSVEGMRNTLQIIRDFLTLQNIDYGLIIKLEGFYILTPDELDLHPMLFKLQTGVNFIGEVELPISLVYTQKMR